MQNQHHNKPSAGRKMAYTAVLLLLLLLTAELIASVYYYHQYGKRKSALAELFYTLKNKAAAKKEERLKKENNYRYQQMVRPGSPIQMTQAVYDETMAANRFVYEPWLEFRNADFSGTYVNIRGFERKTIPSFIAGNKDTVRIWFFGGSTMFGFNVADNETIPSQFAQLFKESTRKKVSLEIYNFGVPYYFSFHEYKLFCQLLRSNKAPQLAVFMDGLNDCWSYLNTYYQQPYFSKTLSTLMQTNEAIFAAGSLVKHFPDTVLSSQQCDTLISNYLHTVSLIEQEAAFYQTKPVFIIQPVPFYQYSNRQNDPVCSKNTYPVFDYVYPKLEQVFSNQSNKLFLGNLHKNAPALPYIDAIHYSPLFSKQIASLILQYLHDQIQ